MSIEDLIEIP